VARRVRIQPSNRDYVCENFICHAPLVGIVSSQYDAEMGLKGARHSRVP
jgi:hypothetical protein